MNDTGPLRLTVPPADDGAPLLEIATAALGSEAAAQTLLARGGAWLNRARIKDPLAVIHAGDTVFLHTPPGGVYAEAHLSPEQILFEDDDLLAVHKPAGMYVEATPWDDATHLRGAAAQLLAARDGRAADEVYLHLVHRLDRDTSGVLLLAKRQEANPALQRAFVGGEAHKQYLAMCAGEPAEDMFTVETGHGRGRQGLFRIYPLEEVGRELPGGARVKPMLTRFAVLARLGDVALVQAEPVTGRTHQIRLHLAHRGHPLLGDGRYGGPLVWRGEPVPHHRLHAARLEIPHPRSGKPLILSAPAPSWACSLPAA